MPPDSIDIADTKRRLIKARGPIGEILELSHQHFVTTYPSDPVSAFVERASDYYSIGGRFTRGLGRVVGAYYGWHAADDAMHADRIGLGSYNQIDVVSTILSKVPQIIGGDLDRAHAMVLWALTNSAKQGWQPMVSHTHAFLYIRFGEIELKRGAGAEVVKRHFDAAGAFQDKITDEMQLCRVAASRGAFYHDHFGRSSEESREGVQLLIYALGRARSGVDALKDQAKKIGEMCDARGFFWDGETFG